MASIQRFDPFNELVDDLFKGFLVRPLSYDGRGEVLPRLKVDVGEKNGAYTVTAELPGVKKEDIQVTIDGAQVTLTAEVKREREASQDERVLHTERLFGKASRSFTPRRRPRPSSATACSSSRCRRKPRRRASRSPSSKQFQQRARRAPLSLRAGRSPFCL